MKLTFCLSLGLALTLASCTALDPEYAAYKKQKEAEAASPPPPSPFGSNSDPYGVPGGDPIASSETGNYAPYQPLPSVNAPPAPDPISPLGTPSPDPGFAGLSPVPGPGPSAGGNTTPHTVTAGDSLWGLAKRYNTSVDAIRAANGIPADSSKILTGQTLQIPSP